MNPTQGSSVRIKQSDKTVTKFPEKCADLYKNLNECHNTKKFGKFLGLCNDVESKLSKCLKIEMEESRRANNEKALKRQAIVRERMKQMRNEETK